jgi:hypothetical protein
MLFRKIIGFFSETYGTHIYTVGAECRVSGDVGRKTLHITGKQEN